MEDAVTKLSERLFHVVVTRLLEKLDLVLSLQYFLANFRLLPLVSASEELEPKYPYCRYDGHTYPHQ